MSNNERHLVCRKPDPDAPMCLRMMSIIGGRALCRTCGRVALFSTRSERPDVTQTVVRIECRSCDIALETTTVDANGAEAEGKVWCSLCDGGRVQAWKSRSRWTV